MKKKFLAFTGTVCFSFLISICMAYAQEAPATVTTLKQELSSDRQQIKEDVLENKENAQAAKTDEEKLKEQIKAATDAGDFATAKQLKDQLKLIHQENVQEKVEDKKELQSDIRELKGDIKEARQDGYLLPRMDKDNNPPGPKGGAGTNWENPPGPKGGPGVSPNRRVDK